MAARRKKAKKKAASRNVTVTGRPVTISAGDVESISTSGLTIDGESPLGRRLYAGWEAMKQGGGKFADVIVRIVPDKK